MEVGVKYRGLVRCGFIKSLIGMGPDVMPGLRGPGTELTSDANFVLEQK